MLKINKLLIYNLCSIILLSSCATNSPINSLNSSYTKDRAPLRYVKDKTYKYNGTQYVTDFAGNKGKSITKMSKQVSLDIFKTIKKTCGFTQRDLIETRIVEHKPPYFYEVWVFKDSKSQRKDKRTGLTVYMHELPNNNGVDFQIKGSCHTHTGMTFTFAN